MVMVNPVSFGTARPLGERLVNGQPKTAPLASASSKSVPVAQLTQLARELAEAGPPVDHAKIAQVRAMIANGGHRIDAAALADAMLRHYHPTGQ
jgi:flagellar biosynthesis anti-sigma factor FlgM